MASQISYTGIDGDFPVAGQDNDSQGFRDNFTTIKSGLQTANSEISTLQTNTAKLNEANDFSGNNITKANILRGTETFYNGGVRSTNSDISFESGHYQAFTVNADDLTFTLTDWPASGKLAKIRVALFGNGNTYDVNWSTENSGTIKVKTDGWTSEVNSNVNPYIYDFWTYDGGTVVYGEYVGYFGTIVTS